MRRAGARGSHPGVQRHNPDRVLCVGALGALMRTVQRPTFSQARAASLTPLVGRAGERIALEADGPSHFNANTLAPGGGMLARRRLLAARGWEVISVPYYVWDELNDAARGAWLMQARLPRRSLLAACLLCEPQAQCTRLMSTPQQLVVEKRASLCRVAGRSGGPAQMICSAGNPSRARGAGGRCSTAARCPAACAQLRGVGCHARAAAHV